MTADALMAAVAGPIVTFIVALAIYMLCFSFLRMIGKPNS